MIASPDRRDRPANGGAAKFLIGRAQELELLESFLDRAATRGEALVLLGEPGVGKTELLNSAAVAASEAGARVLRAAGVEFEADVGFSGLHEALTPLFAEFAQLDPAHRDALNVVLGFGEGPPPDRLVVSIATLALLRGTAVECPLLVIVDDLPWLDRASACTLGFAARRLAGSRVGFLAASRTGEASFFERSGLPELELQPLGEKAARGLMNARFPMLGSPVRERLLKEAQGNPLAVLELPAALSGPQRAALRALPALLPLTRRLQALFRSRVAGLPERSRQLLLLVALDRTGDLRVLRATGDDLQGLDDLAVLERARLVFMDETTHRLTFRHPLIRSAAVELATVVERRRAHRILAELSADQPDRRAWHLAEATLGPDERVAAMLEEAGHRMLQRGDGAGAVAALTRAAGLSPEAAKRAQRLADAAYIGAEVAGELRGASKLLADARAADPHLSQSLQAAVAASYVLLNGDGDVETAHRMLVRAIESAADGRVGIDTALQEALNTLMLVCYFGGRPELWEPFHQAITRLGSNVSEELYLVSKTSADPVRTAGPALARLDTAIDGLTDEVDPTRIVRTAVAGVFLDRLTRCREALWRVVYDGRAGGAVTTAIRALILLGFDDFLMGDWNQSQELVNEAIALSDGHDYRLLAWPARHIQALIAAARGSYDTSEALAGDMLAWAVPRGVRLVQSYAWHAQGLAALGRGDFEEAYQHATKISPAGTLASHVQYAIFVAMDLVEAAVRTGRHAEAADHVRAMREANLAALSPRVALLAAGSAAMAAPDETARELFTEALALPGIDRWPFDLARVQLAYGERLRRAQASIESRPYLTASRETFERLGAQPWAARAASECRATGQTRPTADQRDHDPLTPQEREIAMLAAAGLTNKQIGQRLFLSHRTVGAHLYRVFPKLSITSRAALRDALTSITWPDAPRSGSGAEGESSDTQRLAAFPTR